MGQAKDAQQRTRWNGGRGCGRNTLATVHCKTEDLLILEPIPSSRRASFGDCVPQALPNTEVVSEREKGNCTKELEVQFLSSNISDETKH